MPGERTAGAELETVFIDPRIKFVGVSKLRQIDMRAFAASDDLYVFQVSDEPISVLVPYAMFLEMQKVQP